MLTAQEFDREIAPLRQVLELRRKKYLRFWIFGGFAGFLLAFSAFFCPEAVLSGILWLFRKHQAVAAKDIEAYRFFSVACAVSLSLSPLFSYRGEHGFSVTAAVYTRVFGLLGPFTALRGGGISGEDFRKSGLFPASAHYYPEEGAAGQLYDIRVRFCEALIVTQEGEETPLRARGLLILCELPRGSQKSWPSLLAGPAREALAPLVMAAHAAAPQKTYPDEKLTYAAAALYRFVRRGVTSALGKNELSAEKAYRLKYAAPLRFVRGEGAEAVEAFTLSAQSCAALIPCAVPLFTLGSLFAPALNESHTRLLYDTLKALDELAGRLSAAAFI